ncbi:hypothetical protein BJX61DRAFT_43818 [Aspergillus egyptiacus]|nr:hypothetical protein BJX61DRAFT_43818 [Aspergillus egyptiacus]
MKGCIWKLSLQRQGGCAGTRAYSSFSQRLHHELTSRQLPLSFDYLYPQPSHLLDLTLADLFPRSGIFSRTGTTLPSISHPSQLTPGHHLVYFPPQVPLSQLLPDGTDTLHIPGAPFNRRLWAGGSVKFSSTRNLLLDGGRAVCIESVRDVITKGQSGEERIVVRIERQIGKVGEKETENEIRTRIWCDSADIGPHTSIIENRDLVFMRDKTADQLEEDKAKFSLAPRMIRSPPNPQFRYQLKPTKALLFRFSALTFNAHSIHLDKLYTNSVEGYPNLLVHGPLTLTLIFTALRHHLDSKGLEIRNIEYKNLAPLYVDEELAICGKPKLAMDDTVWDVWIEGRDGGLTVKGTIQLEGDDLKL